MARPKEEWLKEYSKPLTRQRHSDNFDMFCEWAKTDDTQLLEEFKSTDPLEFSKKWGRKIIEYYNHLVKEGLKTNTARTRTIAPRAFLKSQCIEVKVKRGAIAKAKIAMNEHEFTIEEFQRMYEVGNIQDKARLATGISLGWGAYDFINLKWEFIEPYIDSDLEPPIAFWYERTKSGAPTRAHLTYDAINALRTWRDIAPKDTPYVFVGETGHISNRGINKWIKSLTTRAKITTRGKIRFHLLRKFLTSQLSMSGMNQWETKLCVGKTIPTDVLTYLKDQSEELRTKFAKALPRISLTTVNNRTRTRLDKLYDEITQLREENKTLRTVMRAFIGEEKLQNMFEKGQITMQQLTTFLNSF